MPCVDQDYDQQSDRQDRNSLSKRNDELAAELCKLRNLIMRISKTAPGRSGLLGPQLMDEMEEQIAKYRAHRILDKEAARSKVEHQKTELTNRISKIKGLGGSPNANLLDDLEGLTKKIAAIMASDPLDTRLY